MPLRSPLSASQFRSLSLSPRSWTPSWIQTCPQVCCRSIARPVVCSTDVSRVAQGGDLCKQEDHGVALMTRAWKAVFEEVRDRSRSYESRKTNMLIEVRKMLTLATTSIQSNQHSSQQAARCSFRSFNLSTSWSCETSRSTFGVMSIGIVFFVLRMSCQLVIKGLDLDTRLRDYGSSKSCQPNNKSTENFQWVKFVKSYAYFLEKDTTVTTLQATDHTQYYLKQTTKNYWKNEKGSFFRCEHYWPFENKSSLPPEYHNYRFLSDQLSNTDRGNFVYCGLSNQLSLILRNRTR